MTGTPPAPDKAPFDKASCGNAPSGKVEKAEAARQERLAREAAALRENLRRRKQQSRARTDTPPPAAPAEDDAKT
jgi:hypothetical protein